MNGYEPQVGDRVSLTGEVAHAHGPYMIVNIAGSGETLVLADHLTLVERLAPPEEWRLGDVVRNADDPEDAGIWAYADPADTSRPWLAIDAAGGWSSRDALPKNLRLLIRDGLPVPQPEPAPCLARSGSELWSCSLRAGHAGRHEAYVRDSGDPSDLVASWPA